MTSYQFGLENEINNILFFSNEFDMDNFKNGYALNDILEQRNDLDFNEYINNFHEAQYISIFNQFPTQKNTNEPVSKKKIKFNVTYMNDNNKGLDLCDLILEENDNYRAFLKKKRSKEKRKRYTYLDLILQNIQRNFYNQYIIKYLNNK